MARGLAFCKSHAAKSNAVSSPIGRPIKHFQSFGCRRPGVALPAEGRYAACAAGVSQEDPAMSPITCQTPSETFAPTGFRAMRAYLPRIASLAAALCIAACAAGPQSSGSLTINGETAVLHGAITPDVVAEFAQHTRDHAVRGLLLDSPGGNVEAAMLLGDMVHAYGVATRVSAGDTCASACAYVFLSGGDRSIGVAAKVGMHAPYMVDGIGHSTPSSTAAAEVVDWAQKMGVPHDAVEKSLARRADEMWWMTAQDLHAAGVKVP